MRAAGAEGFTFLPRARVSAAATARVVQNYYISAKSRKVSPDTVFSRSLNIVIIKLGEKVGKK